MIQRSVNLTILNPQYAFLEADYKNTSLNNQLNPINEHTITNIQSVETKIDAKRGLKDIVIWLLLKINPLAPTLLWIPADIYCIAILLTGEIMTF